MASNSEIFCGRRKKQLYDEFPVPFFNLITYNQIFCNIFFQKRQKHHMKKLHVKIILKPNYLTFSQMVFLTFCIRDLQKSLE